MLSIKKVLSKILSRPMVIEMGTSGIWTYRKWSDGTAECWARYSKNVTANSIDNNNYVQLPFTFALTPITTLGLASGGADYYDAHIESGARNAEQVRLTLINRYTAAATLAVNLYVIGVLE